MIAVHGATYVARYFKVILIAFFFGTGVEIESYKAALNLPLVISGVVQGALLAAVVPILIALRASHGEQAAARLGTRFGLWTLAAVVALCLGLGFGSGSVARWVTDPARHDDVRTAHLLRLLLGYIVVYILVQYATMLCHSHRWFIFPLLTALPNLAVNIVVIVLWFWLIRVEVEGLVWGLYAGALVQLAIMVARGWKPGILRPAAGAAPAEAMWRATRNTAVLLLSGLLSPATLITVDIIMAAPVERGIATVDYAYAIFMIPVTVGVMNIGHVLLPHLSGQVAGGDWRALGGTVSLTARLMLFTCLPAAVGLWLVSEDLIGVLLERGQFRPEDTTLVAATLRAYSWGLVFAALVTVVTKIFNAMQRVRAIFVVSAIAFAVKIGANALLRGPMGAPGIALATSIFYALSFVLLAIWLRSTVPVPLDRQVLRSLALTLLGGVAMAIAVLGVRATLLGFGAPGVATLLAEVAVGAGVWIAWSAAVRLEELGMIWRLLRRRRAVVSSAV